MRKIGTSLVILLMIFSLTLALQAVTDSEVQAFIEKIGSPDANVRRDAFEHAADMGAKAIAPLGKLLASEDRGVARAARLALEAIVAHASRLGAGAERASVSAALIKLTKTTQPTAVRRQAIELLALVGGEEVVPELAILLRNEELRETARWALERIPGPASSRALAAEIAIASPGFQIALIATLGERRAEEALPALIKSAKSENKKVRLAALEALGRIGDQRAEPVLAEALQKGPEEVRQPAFDAYLRLAEGLLAKKQTEAALAIYERCLSVAVEEHHRCAALVGIGRIGRLPSIPKVLPILADVDPKVRATAIDCLVKMPKQANQAIRKAVKTAAPPLKGGLLRVLVARKDPEVSRLLRAAVKERSAEVRVTAFDLLGELDDPALEPILLEAAEEGSELIKPVALRSYLRIADRRLQKGEKEAALPMYHRALELTSEDELRRQALAGICSIASPDSLSKVEPLIEESEVRNEAIAAYIAIAGTLAETGQRQQAIEILTKALLLQPPRFLSNAAAARLCQLGIDTTVFARCAGFVTKWWLVGPFPSPEKAAWDSEFFPEREIALDKEYEVEGRKLRWKAYQCQDMEGVTDLTAQFEIKENVAAYAYAEVTVDKPQDVEFRIGSDDDVVCWLNSRRIHANKVSRPLSVDQDRVPTRLEAGTNKILLKILQGSGGWLFCLRITDRQGKPLTFRER